MEEKTEAEKTIERLYPRYAEKHGLGFKISYKAEDVEPSFNLKEQDKIKWNLKDEARLPFLYELKLRLKIKLGLE